MYFFLFGDVSEILVFKQIHVVLGWKKEEVDCFMILIDKK